VYEETGVKFKVGVGLAQKAREALKFAAMGLDEIRAGKYPGPIKLFSKIYTDQLK
jgi:GTP cyclohydrolase III